MDESGCVLDEGAGIGGLAVGLEVTAQVGLDLEDGSLVADRIAVVGGRVDGGSQAVVGELIALVDEGVGADQQGELVVLNEFLGDVRAEAEAGSSGVGGEARLVAGVAPEEVCDSSCVGDLLEPVEGADLLDGGDAGREASVGAEYVSGDQGDQWERIENLAEGVPDLGGFSFAVLAETLLGEPVDLVNLTTLVVASEQVHPLGVADLEGQQQADGLDRVVPTVHIVSEEEVLGCGG